MCRVPLGKRHDEPEGGKMAEFVAIGAACRGGGGKEHDNGFGELDGQVEREPVRDGGVALNLGIDGLEDRELDGSRVVGLHGGCVGGLWRMLNG